MHADLLTERQIEVIAARFPVGLTNAGGYKLVRIYRDKTPCLSGEYWIMIEVRYPISKLYTPERVGHGFPTHFVEISPSGRSTDPFVTHKDDSRRLGVKQARKHLRDKHDLVWSRYSEDRPVDHDRSLSDCPIYQFYMPFLFSC